MKLKLKKTAQKEYAETTAEAVAAEAAPPKRPKKARKPKKPWTKKRIIIWSAVAVLVVFLGYSCTAPILAVSAARSQVSTAMGTTTLRPRDITTSISATGTVESADKHYVYPAMTGYAVQEVPVKVGDVVREGDILCILDDSAVQKQIETNELNLEQSLKTANQQVKTVKDSYDAAMASVRDGTNSTLISAQGQVTSAYNAYLSAVDSYNNYSNSSDSTDSAVSKAKAALAAAQAKYDAAEQALKSVVATGTNASDKALKELEFQIATQELAAANAALSSAQAAQSSASGQGSSLYRAVGTAYNSYIIALRGLDAAIASVDTQLQASKNQVGAASITAETARLSKDLTLKQLAESLDDTVVTAPAAGTVTAVYATVGGSGSGLLFVIEDVSDLIVKTTVKAFDVGTVKKGMPTTIKSDSTGNEIYDGSITFIAPAAQKTDTGETDGASEAFDAEVAVSSQNTGLRIGMNVRLNYIVEKQESILAVPYDAIYTNAAGQPCVLAAMEQGGGKYVLTEIPVTMGIESDLDVAISGEGVVEGLLIINEPATRVPGEVVTLV